MGTSVRASDFPRVSMLMQTNLLMGGIRRTSTELLKVQEQMTTGLKLSRPSDDPGAATTVLHLDELLERQDQYLTNIDYSMDYLNATDEALSQARDLSVQAHELALESIGMGTDDDGRRANADIIDSIIEQLVTIANRTSRDSYIFGGQNTTEAPFARSEGGVLFSGSTADMQTRVSAFNLLNFNTDGDEVFGAISGEVRGTADLDPLMTAETLLGDLNGAGNEGVRLGSMVIADGTSTDTIDLSDCVTAGDVAARITDQAVNTQVTAAIVNGVFVVSGAAGADLTISDVGTGFAARDLGLACSSAGQTYTGQDVDARLTPTTPLAALHGGAGIDPISGLRIRNSMKADVGALDISAAQTVGDILALINNADLGVRAALGADGKTLDVQNLLSGSAMTIGENGGTTAAGLGIRSLTGATRLADLNGGAGVAVVNDGAAGVIRITDRQGTTYDVDLSSAVTVQDVMNLINAGTGGNVRAALTGTGNGIELTNQVGGAGALAVTTSSANGHFVAAQLGLEKSVAADTLTGDDVNPIKPDGLFSHLMALRDALRVTGNATARDTAISAADEALQADMDRLGGMQGMVGARAKALQQRRDHMEDTTLATKTLRSDIRDIDFTEAVTRYQNLYTALQANLKTGGMLSNTSLLDFLG